MPAAAEQVGEGLVDPCGGAPVGQYDERAAAAGQGGGDGPGDLLRPGGAGQRRPHRAGRVAVGERRQVVGPLRVAAPAAGPGSGGRLQRGRGRLGLRLRVPGRYGELEDVGEGARVAVRDRPAEPQQGGGEHGLGREHLGERRERAGVVAGGAPLHDEAVVQLPALAPAVHHARPEAHPDPDTGHGVLGQVRRHGVVEELVEVEQPLVHEHPGDRQVLGALGAQPGTRLRAADRLADERELLRRPAPPGLVCAAHRSKYYHLGLTESRRRRPPRRYGDGRRLAVRGADQAWTAFCSSSTRSVRSQVKSGSSRPKWPYAAVWE